MPRIPGQVVICRIDRGLQSTPGRDCVIAFMQGGDATAHNYYSFVIVGDKLED